MVLVVINSILFLINSCLVLFLPVFVLFCVSFFFSFCYFQLGSGWGWWGGGGGGGGGGVRGGVREGEGDAAVNGLNINTDVGIN